MIKEVGINSVSNHIIFNLPLKQGVGQVAHFPMPLLCHYSFKRGGKTRPSSREFKPVRVSAVRPRLVYQSSTLVSIGYI